jgi:hypothetical protein
LKIFRVSGSRALALGGVALLGAATAFACALCLDARDRLRRHVNQESSEIAWVVFLKGHADKGTLEEAIRSLPGIDEIRFISKEEAMETVLKDPALSESITLTGRNPFPETFDVRWKAFFLRPDFLNHAAEKIRELEGIDRVGFDQARVERLNAVQRMLYQLELALLALVWGTALLLVILLGKALFFPNGVLPDRLLWHSTGAGLVGGAVGVALAMRFSTVFMGRAMWSAAAVGLLVALLRDVLQEP